MGTEEASAKKGGKGMSIFLRYKNNTLRFKN